MTRVLVVDDEPHILRALAITLRAKDYEVTLAGNGAGALSSAADAPPDLVVLDLGLPDLDGVEVIRGLRGWTDAPIIVLSGHSGARDKVEALDAGADDYVTKPPIRLTPTEWSVLELLVSNPGKLMTHKELLTRIWGPDYPRDNDYLRVYLARLRRKLEPVPGRPRYLITEPGMGYRYQP